MVLPSRGYSTGRRLAGKRFLALSLLLCGMAGALFAGQLETISGADSAYLWQHKLRIEGHLALTFSPDGAFSPNATTLAVVEQGRVILLNLADGRAERTLHPTIPGIKDLIFQSANYVSPNHLFILGNGVVQLNGHKGAAGTPELAFQWDCDRDALFGKVDAVGARGGFLPPVYFPSIMSVVLYKDTRFTLWNPTTGRGQVFTVAQLTHSPHLFAFSPDGNWLLLAQIETNSSPNPVVVSTRRRQFVDVLPGHHGTVLSMTFSPDGNILETSCEDGKVRLWSVPDWKLLRTLSGNLGPVHWAEFSPDGHYLASAGEDDTVRIWDVSTGKLLQTLEESKQPLLTVAFSPDGHYLAATSENEVHVWMRTTVD